MTRRRAVALVAVWTLPSLVLLGFVAWVYDTWRIHVPPRLSEHARTTIDVELRSALERGAGTLRPGREPELDRTLPGGGPLAVSVFLDGRMVGRVDGYGKTIALALGQAAERLPENRGIAALSADDRRRVRLKIDVVVGRGPVALDHAVVQLVALHPGLEGLGVTLPDGVNHLILPDEMFLNGLLAKKPLTNLMPEIGMGVDVAHADDILARRAGLTPAQWKASPRRYFRFRTDAFVETGHGNDTVPLERGVPPGPPPTAANLRAAALAGARYLVAHLGPNGRYVYEQNLTTSTGTDPTKGGAYSLPRHAGTTYFLAEAYRITHEEWLREPIERAFDHLNTLVEAGGCSGQLPDGTPFACVVDRGDRVAALGSTALGVVALAEYQRATGDQRYLPLAIRLTAWILWMQRPDGSFRHQYRVDTREVDDRSMLLYYSGEAALALARMYVVTGDERYAVAAEKGLDWLVGWYDFLVGGWLYGEDHWTCIASEALWPRVENPRYLDFCNGLADFWDASQAHPGDYPDQPDLVGSQGLTPFVMPQNTPAGSHTEARISTYLLGLHQGHPRPDLRHDILESLGYLLRQQIRPEGDYAVAAAAKGDGGLPGNPTDRTVRIDYVQHVCSAMLRGAELADPASAASGQQ